MMDFRRFLALLALLLLAGCAGIGEQAGEERQVLGLLDEQARLQTLPAEEQQRILAAALAAHEHAPDDLKRLRLALLLALPRASWSDVPRALQLLAEIKPPAAGQPSPRHDLARLLQSLLVEQLRLQAEQRDDARRIDALQKQGAERQRQLQEGQRKVEEERRKLDELQQKLEALRKIDRDIRRRER
jgi:hypothetical protein